MPYIKGTALQDLKGTINATTGALSLSTVQTTGATGAGAGIINWATFFSLLRLGGYSGPAEAQIESDPQEYTYMPGYYAVFFYDPDGLKLEIVHVPALAA